MTVMYAWPFPRPVSSTPIACNPSNMHGIEDSGRPATRPAMSPAVLHAICRKPLTVLWPATVISHAHPDPKSRVNRPPGPAHGTRETTTPCRRHSTRGTGPESPTRKQPKSWCRQLRPPPPLSHPGAFRPQREMLGMLVAAKPEGATPVLHSDMGWQYQHGDHVSRLRDNGFVQSMSRKGNCPDNAATEQVFGHLKDEFFRGRDWDDFDVFKRTSRPTSATGTTPDARPR